MISTFLETNLTKEEKQLLQWSSKSTATALRRLDNSVLDQTYTLNLPQIAELNPQFVKDLTYILVSKGFATTHTTMNFSSLTFKETLLDKSEIANFRELTKLGNMLMTTDTREYPTTLVKRNGKVVHDGIPRPGMMLSAKREFMLDTPYIKEFRRPILQNLIKSIKKGIELGHINARYFADEASYRIIAERCLDNYLDTDARYNSECNVQDQRGRAIKRILKRVGNYIANKDFRAMLKVPQEQAYILTRDDTQSLNHIYLFIAELTGHKCLGLTEADKIEAGRQAYLARELPRLNLKTDEGRKELHEYIWLHRIYSKLDKLYSKAGARYGVLWDILIEIDHTMSLAQIAGALLNDKRVLESTNVLGDTLQDAWYIEGVRRPVAKAYGTPVLYGSSQSVKALVKKKGLLHEQLLLKDNPNASESELATAKQADKVELANIKKAFTAGRFSVLKQFKDLLIQNYTKHEPVVTINTGISSFTIHVNKWKQVGTSIIISEAWNGHTFKRAFTHKPTLIPDYGAMKTFWATCLIHHLDSDLMEFNLASNPSLYALDIHDAILCLPKDATTFRRTARDRLKFYNQNRHLILSKFKESIGATSVKADIQHMKLLKSVVDAGEVEFKETLMK